MWEVCGILDTAACGKVAKIRHQHACSKNV